MFFMSLMDVFYLILIIVLQSLLSILQFFQFLSESFVSSTSVHDIFLIALQSYSQFVMFILQIRKFFLQSSVSISQIDQLTLKISFRVLKVLYCFLIIDIQSINFLFFISYLIIYMFYLILLFLSFFFNDASHFIIDYLISLVVKASQFIGNNFKVSISFGSFTLGFLQFLNYFMFPFIGLSFYLF